MLTGLLATFLSGCAGPVPVEQAWVTVSSPEEATRLRSLPVGFAEGREADRVRVIGTVEELDRVAATGLAVQRLGPPPPLPDTYPSSAAVQAQLESWAETWPDHVLLRQLGTSVEGLPLWGVRLGPKEAPLLHRVVGGTHGDEASSVAIALALGEALLQEDPGFEGLLGSQALWLVPLMNPDGYDAGVRFNRNNVDLNRNFSYLWSASEYAPGTAPFSEPETQALRTLFLGLGAPLGLSLHSGATNLGYVWNHTTLDTAEEDRLLALGQRYSDACDLEGFYLTNGAEWYTTRGDQNDWSYGVQGTLDFTLELTAAKSPEGGTLTEAMEAHLPALATWLEAPVLLQGQLLSAVSGMGLEGTLTVADATAPFLSDPLGHFSHVLEPGTWTVTASAPGHGSDTREITLTDTVMPWTWTLEPQGLEAVRPETVHLSVGGDTTHLTLNDVDPPAIVTLTRPGVDPLNLAYDGTAYPVSPELLVPGPYTLSGDDWVAPRAVFAGTHDAQVTVSSVALQPDCLVLDGQGFAKGAQAWALWGLDRPLVPLEVLSLSPGRLVLDRRDLPEGGTVDVLVLSQGREVAVVDVLGDPELDTAPAPDSGWVADSGEPGRGLRGRCATVPPGPAGSVLFLAWLTVLLRRSREKALVTS